MPNCTRIFESKISLNSYNQLYDYLTHPPLFFFLHEGGIRTITCLKSHRWKVSGSRCKPRSLWLQNRCYPTLPWGSLVRRSKNYNCILTYWTASLRILRGSGSMTALTIFQAREENWHSSIKPAAQMSSSCAGAVGQVSRAPGKVRCVSASDLCFFF